MVRAPSLKISFLETKELVAKRKVLRPSGHLIWRPFPRLPPLLEPCAEGSNKEYQAFQKESTLKKLPEGKRENIKHIYNPLVMNLACFLWKAWFCPREILLFIRNTLNSLQGGCRMTGIPMNGLADSYWGMLGMPSEAQLQWLPADSKQRRFLSISDSGSSLQLPWTKSSNVL